MCVLKDIMLFVPAGEGKGGRRPVVCEGGGKDRPCVVFLKVISYALGCRIGWWFFLCAFFVCVFFLGVYF